MKKVFVVLLMIFSVFISCVHNTDINAVDSDGVPVWVTDIPVNNKRYYGVGSARLSDDRNSLSSAEAKATADVARKLEKTIKQATSQYSMDTEGETLAAFEEITVQTVNITMRGVVKEKQWKSPDGTWWILVSFPLKDIDKTFELEANKYENKLKDRILSIENARNQKLEEIASLRDDFLALQQKIDSIDKSVADNNVMIDALKSKQRELSEVLKSILVETGASDVNSMVNGINGKADSDISSIESRLSAIDAKSFGNSVADAFQRSGFDIVNQ